MAIFKSFFIGHSPFPNDISPFNKILSSRLNIFKYPFQKIWIYFDKESGEGIILTDKRQVRGTHFLSVFL